MRKMGVTARFFHESYQSRHNSGPSYVDFWLHNSGLIIPCVNFEGVELGLSYENLLLAQRARRRQMVVSGIRIVENYQRLNLGIRLNSINCACFLISIPLLVPVCK